MTGEKKKGSAIRKVVVNSLMLEQRRLIGQKFISGEWSTELAGYEKARAEDRRDSLRRARAWR